MNKKNEKKKGEKKSGKTPATRRDVGENPRVPGRMAKGHAGPFTIPFLCQHRNYFYLSRGLCRTPSTPFLITDVGRHLHLTRERIWSGGRDRLALVLAVAPVRHPLFALEKLRARRRPGVPYLKCKFWVP